MDAFSAPEWAVVFHSHHRRIKSDAGRTPSWRPAFSVLPAVAWKDSLKARKKNPKGPPLSPLTHPPDATRDPLLALSLPAPLLLATTQIFQGKKLMNIYKVLAVREIKKKHLKFMKLDPSINNRPVAGGVTPSPTEGFKFSTRSSEASQSCPSMNTRVHKHTELHCEYTVLYACMCMWCIHVCIGVYTSTSTQRPEKNTEGPAWSLSFSYSPQRRGLGWQSVHPKVLWSLLPIALQLQQPMPSFYRGA